MALCCLVILSIPAEFKCFGGHAGHCSLQARHRTTCRRGAPCRSPQLGHQHWQRQCSCRWHCWQCWLEAASAGNVHAAATDGLRHEKWLVTKINSGNGERRWTGAALTRLQMQVEPWWHTGQHVTAQPPAQLTARPSHITSRVTAIMLSELLQQVLRLPWRHTSREQR